MARAGLSGDCRALLEALEASCGRCAALEEFRAPLREALAAEPGPESLGETLLALLRALQAEPFATRMAFVGHAAERLLQVLEQLEGPQDRPGWRADCFMARAVHLNITCDGCGVSPILGPRFKCEWCADYDLCGNCYPHKEALHSEQGGGQHPFRCMLKGGGKGGKGWKGWKGWGKGGQKGDFWAAMMGMAAHAAQQFSEAAKADGEESQLPSCCEGPGDWCKGSGKGHKGHKGGKGWKGQKGCNGLGGGFPGAAMQHFMQHMAAHFQQQHEQQQQQQQQQQQPPQQPQQSDAPKPPPQQQHEERFEEQTPSVPGAGDVAQPVQEAEQPAQEAEPSVKAAEQSVKEAEQSLKEEQGQSTEAKLAALRDMGIGSDEVNRELLAAHGGDCAKVAQLLIE